MDEGLESELAQDDVITVARALCEQSVTERCDPTPDANRPDYAASPAPWPTGHALTAPEAVHWAVTHRCIADCPDCYAARHRAGGAADLTTPRSLVVIDRVAAWGAFQLAIGGGEPLLREDLSTLARHAAARGLAVHVTTSGDGLSPDRIESLAGSLTSLQVGIRHLDLLGRPPTGQAAGLHRICDLAGRAGLPIGANLVLCRTVLGRFEEAVHRLVEAGFRRVVLLRYKPPGSVARWERESPKGRELDGMEERIAGVISGHTDLELRLDCALSFLERRLSSERARKAGLRGCVAGARIVAISPDGMVYPCSQLVDPRFLAGNILTDDPADIWSGSEVLSRLRSFRSAPSLRRSACGACRAVEWCGGCRVFTHEGSGPDPGCPGAVR